VAALVELERSRERRNQKWLDHVGHLRQVEHALLDILPGVSNTAQLTDDNKARAVAGEDAVTMETSEPQQQQPADVEEDDVINTTDGTGRVCW